MTTQTLLSQPFTVSVKDGPGLTAGIRYPVLIITSEEHQPGFTFWVANDNRYLSPIRSSQCTVHANYQHYSTENILS